ncbi:hypothetical protein OSW16_12660 [Pseudomonas putida]|uniref:hypothetical protein n=1 Tax=Pseudomonas putida TaxID=303 RepID=UPI00226FBC4E|nr:hypothetical protein [Pseudomonas putida]WAC00445.1 hypothetical protein OSW16_12660 [Pseudomonas putida]
MKEFYMISAAESDHVPLFFDEVWVPELPAFNQVIANPDVLDFSDSYEMEADLNKFHVDVTFEQYLASSEFIRMCENFNCKFLSIPVMISLRGSTKPEKDYKFFCVLSRCSLLDVERSTFELVDDGLLRPENERQYMSPLYARIDRFCARSDVEYDLFYCEELKQVVCSSEFREAYLKNSFIGLYFEKIDEGFVCAPWS